MAHAEEAERSELAAYVDLTVYVRECGCMCASVYMCVCVCVRVRMRHVRVCYCDLLCISSYVSLVRLYMPVLQTCIRK